MSAELTPEIILKRKEMKNLRNRTYYDRHRENLRQKKRDNYSSDKKKEYYYENQEKVLESQRKHYKLKQTTEKLERLKTLLTMTEEEGLKKLIQTHIENPDELRLCEVLTLEKSIVLVVNKSADV